MVWFEQDVPFTRIIYQNHRTLRTSITREPDLNTPALEPDQDVAILERFVEHRIHGQSDITSRFAKGVHVRSRSAHNAAS